MSKSKSSATSLTCSHRSCTACRTVSSLDMSRFLSCRPACRRATALFPPWTRMSERVLRSSACVLGDGGEIFKITYTYRVWGSLACCFLTHQVLLSSLFEESLGGCQLGLICKRDHNYLESANALFPSIWPTWPRQNQFMKTNFTRQGTIMS